MTRAATRRQAVQGFLVVSVPLTAVGLAATTAHSNRRCTCLRSAWKEEVPPFNGLPGEDHVSRAVAGSPAGLGRSQRRSSYGTSRMARYGTNRAPSVAGVMSGNTTPTTRGAASSPHPLTSPFHPPAQDERGLAEHRGGELGVGRAAIQAAGRPPRPRRPAGKSTRSHRRTGRCPHTRPAELAALGPPPTVSVPAGYGRNDRLCPGRDITHLTHGQVIETLVANRLTAPAGCGGWTTGRLSGRWGRAGAARSSSESGCDTTSKLAPRPSVRPHAAAVLELHPATGHFACARRRQRAPLLTAARLSLKSVCRENELYTPTYGSVTTCHIVESWPGSLDDKDHLPPRRS